MYKRLNSMSIEKYIFHNIFHNIANEFHDTLDDYLKIIKIDIAGSALKPLESNST